MCRKSNYKLVFASLLFLLFHSCNIENEKSTSNDVKNINQDSLAFELCQIYGFDQGIRSGFFPSKNKPKGLHMGWSLILAVDTVNFRKIVAFVKKHGFPSKKLLGEDNYSHECVEAAATAVLLHNPHRLVNEKEYLELFLSEVDRGNLKIEALIAFLDKYYVIRQDEYGNKKLLYGSLFGKPCSYNREKSDSARAVIGLPPLPDSMFVECKTIPVN